MMRLSIERCNSMGEGGREQELMMQSYINRGLSMQACSHAQHWARAASVHFANAL
jgi:hypothetical protein